MKIPKILYIISSALQEKNASAVIVGGSVRDYFLKLPSKDYDIEVYGLETLEELESILTPYGSVNVVGKSFGVLKFSYESEEYDFSFPRRESKVGEGHRGFDVELNGNLDFKTAAMRRDFSMNAMGYDIVKKVFLDPFNGLKDIKEMKLRHIDDKTFVEDPLRVYRAVQFSARFGYELSSDTYKLCKQMVEKGMLNTLPKERVYTEWKKLLLKSKKPSIGFELMKELGILEHYFPELHALIDVPQSPKWHPEGDVWIHTMMALDSMSAQLAVSSERWNNKQKLKFLFAILCHDLGKASSTTVDDMGHIRAIGHERAGLVPTKSLMCRLTNERDFIETLFPLVEHHLKPSQFYAAKSKASAIRRLATKVNIEELVMVAKADFLGRTTEEALTGEYKAGKWLLEKASQLKVKRKPIEHLIQGRDLLTLGFKPSPKFKSIIDKVYELQLQGTLNTREEALVYIEELRKVDI